MKDPLRHVDCILHIPVVCCSAELFELLGLLTFVAYELLCRDSLRIISASMGKSVNLEGSINIKPQICLSNKVIEC